MATEVATPNIAKIHLTERAAKKIRALLEKDGVSPDVGGLRVGVQGGGCSGLSYAMRLDTQARDRDKNKILNKKLKLKKSYKLLKERMNLIYKFI